MLGEPGSNVTGLLFHRSGISNMAILWDARWHLFFSSLVLATVATLESFMALRAAQNAADLYPNPIRSLAAQGLANCFSSAFTFVASAATPSLSMAAYNSGARTRVVGISGALTILIFGVIFSKAVAELPTAVVSGILIALGVAMFDAWSVRSLRELLSKSSPFGMRRTAFNLAVVAAVMLTTVFGSVLLGVGIGCLLSMVIFVADMSKPIIRHQYRGDQLFSKRIRSREELSVLQQTGAQRIVLQLEGVLFFGNAEDLAFKVKQHLKFSDVVVLDLKKVTDIDVSGGNVLASLITKAGQQDKSIIFCDVPPSSTAAVSGLFDTDARRKEAIKPDLDTALEEIEEREIREIRPSSLEIELGHIDLLAGIASNDLERLRSYLVYRRYGPGEALCRQGDAGDRMWLLVQGSVSVRIQTPEGSRRITSLGPGTMVGEMALIEGAHRSATIVADSKVSAFELCASDFDKMLRHEPRIAEQFMRNCARELSKRLRRTTEDLRRSLE
jgi:sulfate permease, SulP family